ncbi:hypothetical protein [Pseudoduganella namucuonensis]|uniref:hypothetical protein n=1 Tax=Pseudoduganella namucuonensis TaxID=1035707 RepID=UPI000B895A10|nr:hypothetical protein [Pseudoduganella namucuonensis]
MRRQSSDYPDVANWWLAAARDANSLYGLFDSVAGVAGEHRTYYGMVRTAVPGGIGGIARGIPSHAALGRTSVSRLGVETAREVVAHEVGHTRHLAAARRAEEGAAGCAHRVAGGRRGLRARGAGAARGRRPRRRRRHADGDAIGWTSILDGPLGNGAVLDVTTRGAART